MRPEKACYHSMEFRKRAGDEILTGVGSRGNGNKGDCDG